MLLVLLSSSSSRYHAFAMDEDNIICFALAYYMIKDERFYRFICFLWYKHNTWKEIHEIDLFGLICCSMFIMSTQTHNVGEKYFAQFF
jgi:hypothetical protein